MIGVARRSHRSSLVFSCSLSPCEFLSAADERHDFHPIAVVQHRVAMLRAGHDFEIHLDGDVRLRDAQLAEQLCDRAAGGDFARLVR